MSFTYFELLVQRTSYPCLLYSQADQICYAVLCVFSYVAAGSEQRKLEGALEAQRHREGHSGIAQVLGRKWALWIFFTMVTSV